ncbi:hypothetical protein KOR42_06080 [Thalassoglobus neptunius]|uniref:Uncharacterized protein n=1 Tax=Thalassoglobus neptunius TaxID=1938619 RepID=A0A5C5X340_9PLAN|nr:hypothetical protein [Thalassoglobus neptunius]TWT57250.1 hypothetical protein KOR42_06080 [Thalassoglobus neptunius]
MIVTAGPRAGKNGFSFRVSKDLKVKAPNGKQVVLPEKTDEDKAVCELAKRYVSANFLTEVTKESRSSQKSESKSES